MAVDCVTGMEVDDFCHKFSTLRNERRGEKTSWPTTHEGLSDQKLCEAYFFKWHCTYSVLQVL